MSVLEEPPMDRLPIQTYVMEYNDEIIREAINRELARNGQVYYVFNRVNQIVEVTSRIAELVPEARVEFAHGQMRERELENIMYQFINGEIDVLVSTTIIETGLDISNVNTMIIHDADNLGLSQLYQLRGRVGRPRFLDCHAGPGDTRSWESAGSSAAWTYGSGGLRSILQNVKSGCKISER